MERRFHWSWQLFDRGLGLFTAICAGIGAYFTAFPPGPPEATPQRMSAASHLATGAPWWALALIGLSAILAVLSLTRSRARPSSNQANSDEAIAEQKRFSQFVEARFNGVDIGMKDIWKRINENNENYSGVSRSADRRIVELRDTLTALEKRAQTSEQLIIDMSAKLGGSPAFEKVINRDIETLISVSWALSARILYGTIIGQSPEFPEIVDNNAYDKILAFISTCETTLIHLNERGTFKNVMVNGEKQVDRVLESSPPQAFNNAMDKLAFRKREISKQQAEWLLDYFRSKNDELAVYLRETLPTLMEAVQAHRK